MGRPSSRINRGKPVRAGQNAGEMKNIVSAAKIWLVWLLICAVAAAVSFARLDLPMARLIYPLFDRLNSLGAGLGSAALLSIEAGAVLTLVMIRITRGHLSPHGEALGLACLTSICAYALNAGVFKLVFGVPNPTEVLQGARHTFDFFHGSIDSSFPSGHMVLAGGFAGVFMRLYRTCVPLLSGLLVAAAALMVLGDWHFVSDVIAGGFIGVSAGLLAGELWTVHSS